MLFIVRLMIFTGIVLFFIAYAVFLTGLLGNNLKKSKDSRKMQANRKNAR